MWEDVFGAERYSVLDGLESRPPVPSTFRCFPFSFEILTWDDGLRAVAFYGAVKIAQALFAEVIGRDSAIYCRSDSDDVGFGEFNARWTAAFSGGKSLASVFHIVSISTRSYW